MLDPIQKPEETPCSDCGVTSGRKVEWTRNRGRVTLCRECHAAQEAKDSRPALDCYMRSVNATVRDLAGGNYAYAYPLPAGLVAYIGDGNGDLPEGLCMPCTFGIYSEESDRYVEGGQADSVLDAISQLQALAARLHCDCLPGVVKDLDDNETLRCPACGRESSLFPEAD